MQVILFSHCSHMIIVVAMLTDNQKETYVLRATPACSFCSGGLIKAKKYNCQFYINPSDRLSKFG